MSRVLVSMLFACVALARVTVGGEVVIRYVTEKEQPFKKLPKDGEKRLVEMYGERQGREMWALQVSQADTTFYRVTVTNEDKVRQATRVVLGIEFLDKRGQRLGAISPAYDVSIDPDKDASFTIDCTDPLCLQSASINAIVRKAEFVELKYGTDAEVAFEWNRTRWFLEDRWDEDKKVFLRTFSSAAYTDKGFDGKVFLPGQIGIGNEERFYRVAREAVPGGFPKDRDLYDIDAYYSALLPGLKVENGQKKKPGLLDTDVVNSDIKGMIEVGEPVRIKEIRGGKKDVILVVAPVCETIKDHRWLRGVMKFVFPKERMAGPDHDLIDRSIREWLEPISIRQVAETCGPNSGTLVKRWDPSTTPDQVEADLGPADARSDTARGEVLAYGRFRLRFADGRLAGVEKRGER